MYRHSSLHFTFIMFCFDNSDIYVHCRLHSCVNCYSISHVNLNPITVNVLGLSQSCIYVLLEITFNFRGVSYSTGKMMRSTSEVLKTGIPIIDMMRDICSNSQRKSYI